MSEDELSEWMTSYVMSTNGPFYFVIVIKPGISAILYREKALSFGIRMGDFLMVKIKKNKAAKENNRAQHMVEEFEKIQPLAETRLEKGHRCTDVILKTKAVIYETTEFNRRKIWMLKNNTFGTFIDLDSFVSNTKSIGTEVEFEFKCKSSPIDMYKSIFIPVKLLGYGESPQIERPPHRQASRPQSRARSRSRSVGPPRKVIGYVGHKQDLFYWVWCKEYNHDVMMYGAHAVPNQEMIGRWVRMLVENGSRNSRPKTCTVVEIIPDVCESRIKNNVPEICVTCTYHGGKDGDYPVFYNELVGNVVDVDEMVYDLEEKNSYRAWIVRHKWEETDSRWKVSPKQDRIFPLDSNGTPRKSSTQPGRLSRSRPGSSRSLKESTFTPAVGNEFHRVRSRDSSVEIDSDDEETNIYSDDDFMARNKPTPRPTNGERGNENGNEDYKLDSSTDDSLKPSLSGDSNAKRYVEEEWKLRPSQFEDYERKPARGRDFGLEPSMSFNSLNLSGKNTPGRGSITPDEKYDDVSTSTQSSHRLLASRSRRDAHLRPATTLGNANQMGNFNSYLPLNTTTERDSRRTRSLIEDFMKSKEVRMAMKTHNAELYDELVGILMNYR